MLINIDNGGTLTDICVVSKDAVYYTKTLTTPTDLSECFFEGINKVADVVYGEDSFVKFLQNSSLIRYSSTQGTNALVERKGPKIGLITDEAGLIEKLNESDIEKDMFQSLVGNRVVHLEQTDNEEQMDINLVSAINDLTTAGAERLIIAIGDKEQEKKYKHFLLLRFPRHLLGSVPVLFSWEFTTDSSRKRRIWSAIINSFLHPTLDNFLYSAEHRLRSHKVKNPLLIYRNDGASSRVSKSVALKTYSSGPRGGLEGTRALADVYGFKRVLMIDVGGTTSDIGAIDNLTILADRRGKVESITTSFELSDVRSYGVGGSSKIRVADGKITVGPESVGSAPGPACFGFGGKEVTITDVNLLLGILDPTTFLKGELNLDAERSKQVVKTNVADVLGVSVEEALFLMQDAFATKMAGCFKDWTHDNETVMAAFGGGGPMSACLVARKAGMKRVLIPKLAAVFSAYGLSFSDVAQEFEADVTGLSADVIDNIKTDLLKQAERHMYQEGYTLDKCDVDWKFIIENADGSEHSRVTVDADNLNQDIKHDEEQKKFLVVKASYKLERPEINATLPDGNSKVSAKSSGIRQVLLEGKDKTDVPVYTLEDQPANAMAQGPAIVEGPFFTARVVEGWEFMVTDAGDLILTDTL